MDYGPGENPDGLNRYWLWDYASKTSDHKLGLVSQQIVEMSILGEVFDPAQFVVATSSMPVASTEGMPLASSVASDVITPPTL